MEQEEAVKEQRAVIVSGVRWGADDLNERTKEGWTVVQMCPMPSSYSTHVGGGGHEPTCMVIIEREAK